MASVTSTLRDRAHVSQLRSTDPSEEIRIPSMSKRMPLHRTVTSATGAALPMVEEGTEEEGGGECGSVESVILSLYEALRRILVQNAPAGKFQ